MTKRDSILADFIKIREAYPRASLVYAIIVLTLRESGPLPLVDLCVEIDDDANSSTVNQAVRRLEALSIVSVDRGKRRNEGHSVSLIKKARAGSQRKLLNQ